MVGPQRPCARQPLLPGWTSLIFRAARFCGFAAVASSAVAALAIQVRAEDLTTLNQIRSRYEQVHEQVSPAIVAVQCQPRL